MGSKKLSTSQIVGKNLKIFIKASKWKTQERFANEVAHVDPVTVRRWLKGLSDVDTIGELAEALGKDIRDFFAE